MVKHASMGRDGDGDGDGAGPASVPPFVLRLSGARDGDTGAASVIGGKARSLLRLSALGLPTPPACVVTTALFEVTLAKLGKGGVLVLPTELGTVEALETLSAIRQGLDTVELPEEFRAELTTALDRVEADWRAEETMRTARVHRVGREEPKTVEGAIRYAVRSSSPAEDAAGALAPGVFRSELDVARGDVEGAVRRVLASACSPAAFTYLAAQRGATASLGNAMAVLIHPFVAGDAAGVGALVPGDGTGPRIVASRGGVDPNAEAVRFHSVGDIEPAVAAAVATALRRAAVAFGAVELEWVARGVDVTFVQMRPFEPGRPSGSTMGREQARPRPALPAPWQWDAAHNPGPLSAAQTGLVEWVNAACATPIEQAVVDGYLYWRPRPIPDRTEPDHGGGRGDGSGDGGGADGFGRDAFDRLVADTDARIRGLGDPPPLEAALAIFTAAYERLFGEITPGLVVARARLQNGLARLFGEALPEGALWFWLDGVASAATRRGAAARTLRRARNRTARAAALERYLEAFGDEGPAWDVVEPTWREAPDRLLRWCGQADERDASTPIPNDGAARPTLATEAGEAAAADPRTERWAACLARLSETNRAELERLVASARVAAAVMEDDDAFYARLQSLVRRALLGLGRQLGADAGVGDPTRLARPDDVFHLSFGLARALAAARAHGAPAGALPPGPAPDLAALARAGRATWERQRNGPPPLSAAGFPLDPPPGADRDPSAVPFGPNAAGSWVGLMGGLAGAPGQAIGRAMHHPANAPPGPGTVLIAATLLPTELPLVAPAAIVTETGSALGHVAAQARERGIPAVVGAAGARARIPEGALVVVDGDRGEVSWRTRPD